MIIIQKKPKYPLMWKHTCVYCAAQWLYDQSEITNKNGVPSVECPNCHALFRAAGDAMVNDKEIEESIAAQELENAGSYQDR